MSLTIEIVHSRMKILILFNHPLMSFQTCISNVIFYGIKGSEYVIMLRIIKKECKNVQIDIFPINTVELKKS